MSRFIYLAGVDQASSVRFMSGFEVSSSSEQGITNIGRIEIDDPAGTLDIVPLKSAYIVETAASPQRLWTGFLYNLTIDRGPYKTGPGRVWRADCVDINFNLQRRIVLSSNGTRPAETDLARVTWLLGNAVTSGLVAQGTLTNLTDNPKNLDAADYRYQTPLQILADIAPQSGKRSFAFYNETTAKVELFYDLADAAVNTSTAKVSNVLADAGAGVYNPFIDASLDRKGEDIFSKWVLRWVGGVTTQENTTTLSTYGENVGTSESSRIGKATTAASQVATILAAHAAPVDLLTYTLILPVANVNDIQAGQRLQHKFSHIPGLSSYTYRRVISRTIRVNEDDNYLVQFRVDNSVAYAIGGGPPTGGFPFQPGGIAVVQYKHVALGGGLTNNITMDQAPGEGDVLVLWATRRGGPVALHSAFTAHPDGSIGGVGGYTDQATMGYRTVGAGESATFQVRASGDNGFGECFTVVEISGVSTTADAHNKNQAATTTPPATVNAGSLTPTAGNGAIIIEGLCVMCSDFAGGGGPTTITPIAPYTELVDIADGNVSDQTSHPLHWVGYQKITSTTGSYATSQTLVVPSWYNFGGWGGMALTFLGTAGAQGPQPGQTVPWTAVTMTTVGGVSTGTTASPYAPGSLMVRVDGVLISRASYTETNPGTGAFSLLWQIDADETVTVSYQGQ